MSRVQTPIIPVVAELIRDQPGAISFGQGVVHYGPPPQAFEAMQIFAADPENHKYQSVQGIGPLIEAIEKKLRADNRLDMAGADILVTAGSNMAFLTVLLAITDPGDEVILLTPYYFNQEMAITLVGCTPVLVACDADFQPDPDRLAAAITPRTRAIVTISPNNPTGAVYDRETLRAINALCANRGLYHISDEAYENFVYDDAEHYSPGSAPGAGAHTVSLYSLSKAYGFASWRIGYMVFPAHLMPAIRKIQDTNLICPPVLNQYAATAVLGVGAGYASQYLPALNQTRKALIACLRALEPAVNIPTAKGAFYLMLRLDIPGLDSMDACRALIREHGVAVIPGSAFGVTDPCMLRVSYGALTPAIADQGMQRLADGLAAIAVRHGGQP